jgi:carboxylesterase
LNVACQPDGERIGLLLLHGLCGSPAEMRYLARGLEKAGYTVHCPTLAGHCSTAAALTETRWEDWYQSAEAGLLHLAEQCDRVVVGGLSTGAVLALRLALKHPERVSGLALYSPTLWLNGGGVPWYAPLFRLVRFRWLARFFSFPAPLHFGIKDERLRNFIAGALATPGTNAPEPATPGVAALERQRLVEDVCHDMGRITAPALAMHPREDAYAGLSNVTRLQEWLGGPVELVILEDSFHLITVDRQRGVVLDRTLEFLASIGRQKLPQRAIP